MTGLAQAIETMLRRSPGHARARPGKEIPGRARGAVHGLAERRRPVGIQVCRTVHDARASRRRIRRSGLRQGPFSVFRFSRLQDRPVRVRNAEADAPVGHEGALTPPDRTPAETFKTPDVAVGQAGR